MKRIMVHADNNLNNINDPVDVIYNGRIIGRAIRTGIDRVEMFIDDGYTDLFYQKTKSRTVSMEVVIRG